MRIVWRVQLALRRNTSRPSVNLTLRRRFGLGDGIRVRLKSFSRPERKPRRRGCFTLKKQIGIAAALCSRTHGTRHARFGRAADRLVCWNAPAPGLSPSFQVSGMRKTPGNGGFLQFQSRLYRSLEACGRPFRYRPGLTAGRVRCGLESNLLQNPDQEPVIAWGRNLCGFGMFPRRGRNGRQSLAPARPVRGFGARGNQAVSGAGRGL